MRITLFLGLLVAVSVSCKKYPSDNLSLQDQDVVITQYDTKIDFPAYRTFAINDTVLFLKNKAGRVESDTGYSQYNDQIVGRIVSNMTALGYQRVGKNQNPQIGLDVVLVNDENIDSYTSWYGSSWYWGWYGYGYYYPWPTTSYYRYEVGSLNLTMLDLTRIDTVAKQIPAMWNSQGVGLVSSTASYNADRIDDAIDVMFEHSPYLKK